MLEHGGEIKDVIAELDDGDEVERADDLGDGSERLGASPPPPEVAAVPGRDGDEVAAFALGSSGELDATAQCAEAFFRVHRLRARLTSARVMAPQERHRPPRLQEYGPPARREHRASGTTAASSASASALALRPRLPPIRPIHPTLAPGARPSAAGAGTNNPALESARSSGCFCSESAAEVGE